MRMGLLAVFPGGDAGRDAEVFEGGAEAVAVIAAVGDQRASGWQRVNQQPGAFVIAHLSLG